VPQPVAARTDRDAFGDFTGRTRFTEHFAIKWGSEVTPDGDDLDTLARVLEEAWRENERLGLGQPLGTDVYYANFYLAGTGPETPTIGFVGGYATLDDDDVSYITMALEVVEGLTEGTPERSAHDWQSGVVHEVHHLFQMPALSYARDLWFWEAWANWFSNRLRPGNTDVLTFAGLPPLLPYAGVKTSTFNPSGAWGRHQYGIWVWPDLMVRAVGDELVSEIWSFHGVEAEPIEVLGDTLGASGTSLEASFADYAARRHVGDHEHGETILERAARWAQDNPTFDHRITGLIPVAPEPVTLRRPRQRPEAFASNFWRSEGLFGPGTLTVAFAGEREGTQGTPASFSVRVRTGEGWQALGLRAHQGSWTAELAEATKVDVVVATHPGVYLDDEVFGYALEVDYRPLAPAEPSERTCHTSGPAAPLSWVLLGLALVRRRRQWVDRPPAMGRAGSPCRAPAPHAVG